MEKSFVPVAVNSFKLCRMKMQSMIPRYPIEAEDQEQFIEECVMEYPDEFSEDNYVDAFNWITVTLHCVNCDDKNEWINLELS